MKKFIEVSKQVQLRSSRLFNNSIETILGEVIQNARRSGAKEIHIDWSHEENAEDRLTIQDNGSGIFRDGFNITLGSSGWGQELVEQEDAAGMGLFSLAQRNPTIISHNTKVQLTAAHFDGLEAVEVESTESFVEGTIISFDCQKNRWLASWVQKVVELLPVQVFLEGEELNTGQCLVSPGPGQSVAFKGLRIGAKRSLKRAEAVSGHKGMTLVINYFGVVVCQPVKPALPGLSRISAPIYIDVLETGKDRLQLVLPGRTGVVENDFFTNELVPLCYKVLAQKYCNGNHGLHYETWRDLRLITNVDIPEPRSSLRLIDSFLETDVPLTNRWIVEVLQKQVGKHLQRVERDGSKVVLFAPSHDGSLRGYGWYDSIPVVQALEVWAGDELLGTFTRHMEVPPDGPQVRVVNSLTVKLVGTDLSFNPKVFCTMPAGDCSLWEEWPIYVVQGTALQEICDDVEDIGFEPSGEVADSDREQRTRFINELIELLRRHDVVTQEDCILETIRCSWYMSMRTLLPRGYELRLSNPHSSDKPLTFELISLPRESYADDLEGSSGGSSESGS